MRQLSDDFVEDLKCGRLCGLLETVISDPSLCLEMRGSAVHVYYRGGRLMEVNQRHDGYSFGFDSKYFKAGERVDLAPKDVGAWLEAVPKLKNAIDHHQKSNDEREFQQSLLRENNFGRIAQSTDYYVCDIEYAASGHGRFDLVAVSWPTTKRRRAEGRRLVFIEMKYGDSALDGKAGVGSHVKDLNCFLADAERVRSLKDDMVNIFNQKRYLGLVKCNKDIKSFSDERPLLLLVFDNHQPRSSTLAKELGGLPDSSAVEVCMATASFMGYGLYCQCVHSLNTARKRFGDYVYSRT